MYKRQITELERVLIERDNMSSEEAYKALKDARDRVYAGEDPEEVLLDEFGLEPDYILDLL